MAEPSAASMIAAPARRPGGRRGRLAIYAALAAGTLVV